jgi:hypothetical protein
VSLRVPQTTKQSLLATNVGKCSYVAEAANAIGSTIVGSSFSDSLTLVEMGHIRIGSAGTASSGHQGQARRSAIGYSRRVRGSGACGRESRRPARWRPS